VGTRWREERRALAAHGAREMWVTRMDPERMYRAEGEERGVHYLSELRFEDAGVGATLVTMVLVGVSITRAARAREASSNRC